MEDLMKPVALNQEMVQTLDQMRAGAENALYGASPAQAEELFKKHLASLIQGSGMPVLQVMHYQWFLRELARLWRTRKGRDLAFHLELCIRKWVGLGLEPRTLQFLICEAHQRLKGREPFTVDREPSSASPLNPDPQPLTPDIETAKDAKTAKAGPDSDPRTPEPLAPRVSS
jgi:hypothetical protein